MSPVKRKASQTTKRVHDDSGSFVETPRIISAEEKRHLILAHASRRPPNDPMQRMTLWAGVGIAVFAVVGGWWYTVGQQIQRNAVRTTSAFSDLRTDLEVFQDRAERSSVIQEADLLTPTPHASAGEAAFMQLMERALTDDASSTHRADLLSPNAPTSSPAVNGTSTDDLHVTPYPLNPFMDGLIPDTDHQ